MATNEDIKRLLDFYNNGPRGHDLYQISQLLPIVLSLDDGQSPEITEEIECICKYTEYCYKKFWNHCSCCDINETELNAFTRRCLKLLGHLKED